MTERLSAAALRRMQGIVRAKRVEGAQRTVRDGITFDSKREADRWSELVLLQRAGAISDLERQVPIGLEGQKGPILTDSGEQQRRYVADFRYLDRRTGAWVIEDAKGHPTDTYKLKRAILAAMGIAIREV